jgi:hypothetical protein
MLREQIENSKKTNASHPPLKKIIGSMGCMLLVLTDLAIVFVTYFGLGYWQGHESWGHSVNYSPIPTNTHKQLNSLNWERGYLILTAWGIQYEMVNQKSHFESIGPLGCTVLKANVRAQSRFHIMGCSTSPNTLRFNQFSALGGHALRSMHRSKLPFEPLCL